MRKAVCESILRKMAKDLDESERKELDEYIDFRFRHRGKGHGTFDELTEEDRRRLDEKAREYWPEYFEIHDAIELMGDKNPRFLVDLFVNPILSYDPKGFDEYLSSLEEGEDQVLLKCALSLNSLCSRSILRKYSRKGFRDFLCDPYDINPGIADELAKLYEDNYMRLSLGYLHDRLSRLLDKEE